MSYTFNYNMNNMSCSQRFSWGDMAMYTLGNACGQFGFGGYSMFGNSLLGGSSMLFGNPANFFGCGSLYNPGYFDQMAGFQIGYSAVNIAGGLIGRAVAEHKAAKAEALAEYEDAQETVEVLETKIDECDKRIANPEKYVDSKYKTAVDTADENLKKAQETKTELEAKQTAGKITKAEETILDKLISSSAVAGSVADLEAKATKAQKDYDDALQALKTKAETDKAKLQRDLAAANKELECSVSDQLSSKIKNADDYNDFQTKYASQDVGSKNVNKYISAFNYKFGQFHCSCGNSRTEIAQEALDLYGKIADFSHEKITSSMRQAKILMQNYVNQNNEA